VILEETFQKNRMKIVIEIEIDEIGAKLKFARELAGISLNAAGNLGAMTGSNLSRIENEETKRVPLPTLIRAARAVNLDLNSLLGRWADLLIPLEQKE